MCPHTRLHRYLRNYRVVILQSAQEAVNMSPILPVACILEPRMGIGILHEQGFGVASHVSACRL